MIKRLLDKPLRDYPDKEIVYRDKVRYGYSTFYDRLNGLANGLESIGAKPGSKIGIVDWNTHQYLESMFAIPMMGSIIHSVNLRLAPEDILYTLKYVQDDYIIIRDEFVPLVEKLAPNISSIKGAIITGDYTESPKTSYKPTYLYEDLIRSSSAQYAFPELDEDKDAYVYFTSGTTGRPKALHFSDRQIIFQGVINALALAAYPSPCKLSSTETIMHIPPFFHGMGWTFPYLCTMLGNKQVLPGSYDPKIMLDLIRNEKVTYAAGVPVFLRMMLGYPKVEEYRDALDGFKFVCDGEHPPKALFEQAKKLGIKMIEAYGMSEGVGYTFSVLKEHMLDTPWESQIEWINKAGLPAPLVSVKVETAEGIDAPKDGKTMGEVLVKSPGLIQGYWNDEAKTAEAWDDKGWFHTGDIGVWDREGYLLVVDRAKDVIKSGGEWISSVGLQEMIGKHPGVQDAAVIPVPSQKWSERPLAIVSLKPDFKGKVAEEDLRNFLVKDSVETGRMPKWWVPDKFIMIEEMPRTSVGKIDKKVLKEKYKDVSLP